MKRPITDSKKLNLLRMFDEFARERGIPLSDQECSNQFIEQVASALKVHRATPTVVHGFL
jgi:fructosamine-3-kinase